MNAIEYIEFALSHEKPRERSVHDPEFQAMTDEDKEYVISKFDGYGFVSMLQERIMLKQQSNHIDEQTKEDIKF